MLRLGPLRYRKAVSVFPLRRPQLLPARPNVQANRPIAAGWYLRPRGQVLPLAPTLSTAMAAETISMP